MLLEAQSALCNPSNPAPHQDRQQKTTTRAPSNTHTLTPRVPKHTGKSQGVCQITDEQTNSNLKYQDVRYALDRIKKTHHRTLANVFDVDVQTEDGDNSLFLFVCPRCPVHIFSISPH